MRLAPVMVVLLAAASLSGCMSAKPLVQAGPAEEELLISTAIDDATAKLRLTTPSGERIYVRRDVPDSLEGKYLIGRIRERLLEQGYPIADQPKDADLVLG